jgi:hypothetical protein
MRLTSLNLDFFPGENISPLRGLPIQTLHLTHAPLMRDLSRLKGMDLVWLDIVQCINVRDIKPLHGMPLTAVELSHSGVGDISPLAGMKLETIGIPWPRGTRGLEVLQPMKSLKAISVPGDKDYTPAEFWKKYNKGDSVGSERIQTPWGIPPSSSRFRCWQAWRHFRRTVRSSIASSSPISFCSQPW